MIQRCQWSLYGRVCTCYMSGGSLILDSSSSLSPSPSLSLTASTLASLLTAYFFLRFYGASLSKSAHAWTYDHLTHCCCTTKLIHYHTKPILTSERRQPNPQLSSLSEQHTHCFALLSRCFFLATFSLITYIFLSRSLFVVLFVKLT